MVSIGSKIYELVWYVNLFFENHVFWILIKSVKIGIIGVSIVKILWLNLYWEFTHNPNLIIYNTITLVPKPKNHTFVEAMLTSSMKSKCCFCTHEINGQAALFWITWEILWYYIVLLANSFKFLGKVTWRCNMSYLNTLDHSCKYGLSSPAQHYHCLRIIRTDCHKMSLGIDSHYVIL